MARDILSEYGRDSSSPQKPRATSGGVTRAKDLPYSPPVGPRSINHEGVGLGGDNHDCGMYGSNEHMTGSPGIGGTNHGNSGSQGRR